MQLQSDGSVVVGKTHADDAVTGGKLANDISISTTGNINIKSTNRFWIITVICWILVLHWRIFFISKN